MLIANKYSQNWVLVSAWAGAKVSCLSEVCRCKLPKHKRVFKTNLGEFSRYTDHILKRNLCFDDNKAQWTTLVVTLYFICGTWNIIQVWYYPRVRTVQGASASAWRAQWPCYCRISPRLLSGIHYDNFLIYWSILSYWLQGLEAIIDNKNDYPLSARNKILLKPGHLVRQ